MISDDLFKRPLRFKPVYKEKIWGGDSLRKILSKNIPDNASIGESWELSGYGSDLSVLVSDSPTEENLTIKQIIDTNKRKLLGITADLSYFPLLYKFIDAHDNLSVQVHPNDIQAQRMGSENRGKTECWYVVDAIPQAMINVGLKHGVSLQQIESCIKQNTFESLLNYIPVKKGDVLFVPAGTVHAILKGTLLYEVQQTSDTTFRLYDWNRVDEAGNSRPLHIEESLKVMDNTCSDRYKISPINMNSTDSYRHFFRVACKYFALEEFDCRNSTRIKLPKKKSFAVITLLNGNCSISTPVKTVSGSAGDTILLPAEIVSSTTIQTIDECHFLVSTVPDLVEEVIAPLREKGFSDHQISLLAGPAHSNDIVPLL